MTSVPLKDHVTFLSGFAFKSKSFNTDGNGNPIVRIRDVVRGYSETYYSGDYDEKYLVKEGDFLIGMDGEFNLSSWKSKPALLNQRVCKIEKVSEKFDIRYVTKFLKLAIKKIEDETPFVTVKHLSIKKLNEIQIPLPPLAEQKRIAGILDTADALRTKRRETLAQLDQLLQSTFLDLFGDPVTNPKGWEKQALNEWLENIDSGWSPKCEQRSVTDKEWGVLKLGAITWCVYDESENKALPAALSPRPKLEVKRGDLLFARKNTHELVAAAAYVYDTRPKLMLPDLIFRLRLKADCEVEKLFLWQLLIEPHQRSSIQKLAGGAAGSMPNISKAKLKGVELIKPPLTLQQKFASIVESIERQKARHRAHLAELDTLFASLQHRAFTGQL